jgi:hydrogenase-4 component F
MIALLFIPPLAMCALLIAFRSKTLNRIVLICYASLVAVVAVFICAGNVFYVLPDFITAYFSIDPLSKFFFIVLAVVNLGVTLYSVSYFKAKSLDKMQDTLYAIFHILFITSMTGGTLSSHLAFSWVFIEATTLSGAVLISIERERTTLEAVWKYIFICSIGVSLSYIGIVLLSMGSAASKSLFFSDLVSNAGKLNPLLLKLSFAFILVGFGTKMGLSPVHAWLPDAHSEAPSPVSALLSGVLLNASVIVIIRFTMIMNSAGLQTFAGTLIIIMGVLSLLVSAAYIAISKNYKRMLAYSSIENMGIIAIGIGVGGAALFVSLLQTFVHSLAKSGLFLTSGNIYRLTGSKRVDEATGIFERDRMTAYLWIAGFIALSGLPPFGGFWSKLFLAKALIGGNQLYLFITVFLLLIVIIAGMSRIFMIMVLTPKGDTGAGLKGFTPLSYIPQILFLLILLVMGFTIPEPLKSLIENAHRFILGGGA